MFDWEGPQAHGDETTQTVEVEGSSLEEAQSELESRLLPGWGILPKDILSDVETFSARAIADTVEDACSVCRGKLPAGALIVAEKVRSKPRVDVLAVEAHSSEEARDQASGQLGENSRLGVVRLREKGRRGLLGIGKSPNEYRVEVIHCADVQTTAVTGTAKL